MKSFLIILLLGGLYFIPAAMADEVKKEFTIAAGEEKIVKIPKLKGLSNGGDIIEDIILQDGESVMFRAISWGQTQITAWDNLGKQYIFQINVEVPKYVQELQTFLQSIEGVKLSFLGRNIIVEGQILRQSDIAKLKGILATFPQVKNMVNMEVPTTDAVLLEALKMELGNQNIKTSPLGGEGLIIEGQVLSDAEKSQTEALISFYFKSVYPTVNIAPVELKVSTSLAGVRKDALGSKHSPFATYLGSTKLNSSYHVVPYTFFDSFTHQDIINTLTAESGVTVLESTEAGLGNQETAESSLALNQTHRLSTQIKTRVLDRNWADIEISLSLQEGTTTLATRKERVILKNGRGLVLLGLDEWISNAQTTNSNNISVSTLGSLPECHAMLVITPAWNLKT